MITYRVKSVKQLNMQEFTHKLKESAKNVCSDTKMPSTLGALPMTPTILPLDPAGGSAPDPI